MKNSMVPERSDIVEAKVIEHDINFGTRMHIEKEGDGPIITDHFADRRQYIMTGECVVEFLDYTTTLQSGSEIYIPKGTPARMLGRCSLVTVIEPVLLERFVTFDNQELSRQDKRALRRTNRAFESLQQSPGATDELLQTIVAKFSKYIELVEELQQTESNYVRRTTALRR